MPSNGSVYGQGQPPPGFRFEQPPRTDSGFGRASSAASGPGRTRSAGSGRDGLHSAPLTKIGGAPQPAMGPGVQTASYGIHPLPSDAMRNPDALPHHPVPVRAGLMQHSGIPQSSKPPPIRQYNNGNTPPANSNRYPAPPSSSDQGTSNTSSGSVTQQELQQLRHAAESNQADWTTQLLYAKKLVEAATVLADESGRADPKTRARNRERFIMEAHRVVKKLVSAGSMDAMFYLAECHGSGMLGLAKDPKEAFLLYQSAAKLGHPQSAYRVAVCCEMGQDGGGGTRQDPVKAFQWYKRAATLGDPPAMYKLGVIQLKGLLGQQPQPREAVSWLQRAADRADEENPHALHELVSEFSISSTEYTDQAIGSTLRVAEPSWQHHP